MRWTWMVVALGLGLIGGACGDDDGSADDATADAGEPATDAGEPEVCGPIVVDPPPAVACERDTIFCINGDGGEVITPERIEGCVAMDADPAACRDCLLQEQLSCPTMTAGCDVPLGDLECCLGMACPTDDMACREAAVAGECAAQNEALRQCVVSSGCGFLEPGVCFPMNTTVDACSVMVGGDPGSTVGCNGEKPTLDTTAGQPATACNATSISSHDCADDLECNAAPPFPSEGICAVACLCDNDEDIVCTSWCESGFRCHAPRTLGYCLPDCTEDADCPTGSCDVAAGHCQL